jgi:hypothetical protein
LARGVECFWTLQINRRAPAYPVLPDGCVDIVFSRPGELRVVGAMTRPQMSVFSNPPAQPCR